MVSKASFPNFIIHPFSQKFSKRTQVFAFLTTLVLGILTIGICQIVCKTLLDRKVTTKSHSKSSSVALQILNPPSKFTPFIDRPLHDLKKGKKLSSGEDITGKSWFHHDHIRTFSAQLHKDQAQLFMPTVGVRNTFSEGQRDDFKINEVRDYFRENDFSCKKRFMAFPIQKGGNHFVLLFIDRKLRTVEYYDSLSDGNTYCKKIAKILTAKDPGKAYKVITKIEKPLQHDSYQCGPWTCFFLEHRLKNPKFDFNSINKDFSKKELKEMMALYRNKVILDICEYQSLYKKWFSKGWHKYQKHYGDKVDTKFDCYLDNEDTYKMVRRIFNNHHPKIKKPKLQATVVKK